MNKVRKTQVDSFNELQTEINDRQKSVYSVLTVHGNCTNREIAKYLQWDINRVTGRVTELVNLGKVKSNGTYKDKQTNRTVTLWKAL